MPETVLQAEGLTKVYKSAERDLIVLDHVSFVAVKRGLGKQLIHSLKDERIKRKKVKIQLSR